MHAAQVGEDIVVAPGVPSGNTGEWWFDYEWVERGGMGGECMCGKALTDTNLQIRGSTGT